MRSNSITVISLVIAATVLSSGLAFLAITGSTDYMDYRGYSKIVYIFSFYEKQMSNPEHPILILGSSNALEGIDAIIVERELDVNAYNLGISGDDILRRSTELDYIKAIQPNAVVLVTLQCFFSDSYQVHDDQYALVSRYIDIPDDDPRYKFLSERTHELVDMKYFARIFYRRKFVIEMLFDIIAKPFGRDVSLGFLWGAKNTNTANLKNMTLFDKVIEPEDLREILQGPNKNKDWFNNYSLGVNNKKIAFEYFVSELVEVGIPVIVVNMPLNPIFKEVLEDEVDNSYRVYLQDTCNLLGCEFLDYEDIYGDDAFKDSTHIRLSKKSEFSSLLVTDLEGII